MTRRLKIYPLMTLFCRPIRMPLPSSEHETHAHAVRIFAAYADINASSAQIMVFMILNALWQQRCPKISDWRLSWKRSRISSCTNFPEGHLFLSWYFHNVDGFVLPGASPVLIIGLHPVRNRDYPIVRQPIHAFDIAIDTLIIFIQWKAVNLSFPGYLWRWEVDFPNP